MPDERSGAGDRFLAPVIGNVLSIDWGGPTDQLTRGWPDAQVVRQAEDVQTLVVPQVPFDEGSLDERRTARAECTFTWEGLVSVRLSPTEASDAAFQALCAFVTREFGGALRQADLGYLTGSHEGTRMSIDRLERVIRLEEAS